MSELLVEEFERIDKLQQSGTTLTGTPTGLKGLDGITSGLQPSNLIILAARPSMGKTALALGIARHIGAERNIPVAVFTPGDVALRDRAAPDVLAGAGRLAAPAHGQDAAARTGRA